MALATAKTEIESIVMVTEENETPDSGYLSRRYGTGGTGLGHCDIMEDQVGFEAALRDWRAYQPTREQRRLRHKVGGYLTVTIEVLYKEQKPKSLGSLEDLRGMDRTVGGQSRMRSESYNHEV